MINISSDVSFIRARDPSIQNYYLYRERLKKSRKNIECLMDSPVPLEDSVVMQSEPEEEDKPQQEDNCIQVYLRVKASKNKSQDYIIQGNMLTCEIPEQPSTSVSVQDKEVTFKKYSFTKIFGPTSKQTEIFESVVKVRVLEFINGENMSLFTYGASGAGKTFTIVGNADEPGLIPRALEYLFRTLPALPDIPSVKPMPDGRVSRLNQSQREAELEVRRTILESQKGTERIQNIKTYTAMQSRLSNDAATLLQPLDEVSIDIWVSFAEIYNEEIFDLLQPTPSKGKQKTRLRIGSTSRNVYIKDLTHVNVSNGLEAFQVFQHGIQKLKYAKTSLNSRSSRSHSIFSIKIAQSLINADGMYVSAFNFCDLAGVERSKKTMNVGERLKESNSINTSLMVLGRCIAALRNSQKSVNSNQIVPFRDSKLTQLFQKALSGLEDFCMFVNINTMREMIEENHTVLNFSAMTKEIVMQSQYGQKLSQSIEMKKQEYLRKLDDEIDDMKLAVSEMREKYLELKKNRDKNLKSEKQAAIEGWEEVLRDTEIMNKQKIKALENKYEIMFNHKCEQWKRRYEEKIDRSKKRKLAKQKLENEDIMYLKEKSISQQATLTKLQERIHDLKEEKKELLENYSSTEEALLIKRNVNNELMNMLKETIEIQETDSFLKNEIACAVDPLLTDETDSTNSNVCELKEYSNEREKFDIKQ